jgi:predicted nucleotide-binding protein (sugar kinase/HSP70/actin superfamily)
MKITFPHMGHTWVVIKGLLQYLEVDVVVPPLSTMETLNLGTQHAPEFACLPLKLNLGNLIQAKELGADSFLMAGGVGPCRFGLYAQMQKEILQDAGYEYQAYILEPPEMGWFQFLQEIRAIIGQTSWWWVLKAFRLAYRKACLVDSLEMSLQAIRPRELFKGTADKVFINALRTIDQATSFEEAEEAYGLARQKLLHVPQEEDKEVLRVGLVGEIFTLLEPFASLNIEKKLGCLGVHVQRSLYLSEWIRNHLFPGILCRRSGQQEVDNLASPFLNHFVGGHARESIASGVDFAQRGFQGIIQVAPLTCMPEIVAHSKLKQLSFWMPILRMSFTKKMPIKFFILPALPN